MIKVGITTVFDEKKQKDRKAEYRDISFDVDGWADAKNFLPENFDLVYLKSPDREKILSGWISGKRWDGYRIEDNQKINVTHWKRHD